MARLSSTIASPSVRTMSFWRTAGWCSPNSVPLPMTGTYAITSISSSLACELDARVCSELRHPDGRSGVVVKRRDVLVAAFARRRRLEPVLLHLVDGPSEPRPQHRWSISTRSTPATMRFLRAGTPSGRKSGEGLQRSVGFRRVVRRANGSRHFGQVIVPSHKASLADSSQCPARSTTSTSRGSTASSFQAPASPMR